MSRLAITFNQLRNEGRKALIPYLTAGDPNLAMTHNLAIACEKAGADILELGIPFSDPLADGPTIQAAAQRALANGVTFKGILDSVRQFRLVSEMPIVFLVYYNAICRRGEDEFLSACAAAGVDGLVVPDLPFEQGVRLRTAAAAHAIDVIQMLAPTSDTDRVKQVSVAAAGFIYCVSLMGVTGARPALPNELNDFLAGVQRQTDVPLVVGFGISRPELGLQATEHADGVIVGSALIDVIDRAYQQDGEAVAIAKARAFLEPFRIALDSR